MVHISSMLCEADVECMLIRFCTRLSGCTYLQKFTNCRRMQAVAKVVMGLPLTLLIYVLQEDLDMAIMQLLLW
jgi:hypothetical protein